MTSKNDQKDVLNRHKKAVGYVRVSTSEQSENGISLDAQRERIEAFCKAKGYELTQVYADPGESATKLDRPALNQLIEDIKEDSIDVVVVLKLDRLTRSVRDLGKLIDDIFKSEGVAFASVQDSFDTSTPNGRLIMNILGTVAQWEAEIIQYRTKEALDHKRSKGEWAGRIPFGWKLNEDGKLVEDPEEQEIIQKVKRARRRGRTYREIADTYPVSRTLAMRLCKTDLRSLKAKYGSD